MSCSCWLSSIVCMLPIFLLPQCASFTAEQRRSEPSGETVGTVGGGEGLMKMNAYAVTEFKWRVSQLEERRGICAWQRSNWWCGHGKQKQSHQRAV